MTKALTPRIIPRSEHPISRSLVSPNALKVLYRLKDHGHIAWLVGGCVRDLLLGREPKDFDVVTDATPGQIKRLFRNCRLVGRRFRLAHLHFIGEIIEVSTFRSLVSEEPVRPADDPQAGQDNDSGWQPNLVLSEDGLVLRDNVFGSPEEDALRRDFTVNALAYDIADYSLIDYVGGLEDLQRGIIRTIGDPLVRFTEDPVRMLRAVRFAALLGFTIHAPDWQAILHLAPTITRASAPRLYEEFLKLFLCGEGERIYQLLRQSGLFAPLFPGVSGWLDREADGFPHVRLGRNLEWLDCCRGEARDISPPLLLALMFGEYLEEWSAELRGAGLPPQDALSSAVAAFLAEQVPLVAVPHRVGLAAREILSLQRRFERMPGKRPHSVLGRPAFADALTYLRCRCQVTGEGGAMLTWWEAFARDAVLPPLPSGGEAADVPKPRRRRRRRKRRTASPADPA